MHVQRTGGPLTLAVERLLHQDSTFYEANSTGLVEAYDAYLATELDDQVNMVTRGLEVMASEALRTAKVGDVFGPVLLAGSDGSKQAYLVQVSSTTGPTFDQARAGLEQQLEQSSGSASDEFLATLLKKADISVDPRFGTWNEDKAAVLPPTTPQL